MLFKDGNDGKSQELIESLDEELNFQFTDTNIASPFPILTPFVKTTVFRAERSVWWVGQMNVSGWC